MALNILNRYSIEKGGPHRMRTDPRLLQGIGRYPSLSTNPFMLMIKGPLPCLSTDTHPLGITLMCVRIGHSIESKGITLARLGDHQERQTLSLSTENNMCPVLLQIHIESQGIVPTTMRSK